MWMFCPASIFGQKEKSDSFDTRVSETIGLFLLPKILAGQGFSAFSVFSKFHCAVVSTVFKGVRWSFLASAKLTMKLFQGKSFIMPVKVSL